MGVFSSLFFTELAGSVLLPLQRLFPSASPQWKAELLRAYTRLLHRWASQDWARHYNGEARPILLTPTSTSVDHFRTLFQFVSYVDNLSSVALSIERDHVLVQHAVLGFFETVRVASGWCACRHSLILSH